MTERDEALVVRGSGGGPPAVPSGGPLGSATPVMPRERGSVTRLFWSFWMIGLGGMLLGMQRQATGEWIGTGFAALGVGARRSAAKSAIVKSISCPTAETTGIRLA